MTILLKKLVICLESNFGEYLKSLRIDAKMGSRELSQLINKGTSYVSQIENGRNKNPDYVISYTLLSILGVDTNEIEGILSSYGINPPDNLKPIDFERDLGIFIKELLETKPKDINFIKEFDESQKQILMKKVSEIKLMLELVLDYSPNNAAITINKLHPTVEKLALESISENMREVLDSADLRTISTLARKVENDLQNRGLSFLIEKERK